ncbi:MAG: hypothetical protein ACXW2C_01440 [Acidimicrobiia bacterium]
MTAPSSLAAPPVPPGSLTLPSTGREVLVYLEAFDAWIASLRGTLGRLDADAQLATRPDAYTADITLAMSLQQSITSRRDDLAATFDSGRVGPEELAESSRLMWGRLPDPLGSPSAFTLVEACTLVAALVDRLIAALSTDAVAGSGVAAQLAAVRAAIARCRSHIEVLGISATAVDRLAAGLEAAVATGDRDQMQAEVARVDAAITTIERRLIKEASTRSATAHQLAELQVRYDDLERRTASVVELAERCRSRIVDPPRLAVPSVAVLGSPPAERAASARTADDWVAARTEIDGYSARLERCGLALAEAERAYGAPLQQRDELRGLLGAYRTRAARTGFAEDLALTDAFRAAHDLLWSAPCDLAEAARRVERYQQTVRLAVGADHVSPAAAEPGLADADADADADLFIPSDAVNDEERS